MAHWIERLPNVERQSLLILHHIQIVLISCEFSGMLYEIAYGIGQHALLLQLSFINGMRSSDLPLSSYLSDLTILSHYKVSCSQHHHKDARALLLMAGPL